MSTNIVGIHFPKQVKVRPRTSYIIQTKNGRLITRKESNLPNSDRNKFHLMLSKQLAEEYFICEQQRLIVKNVELEVPDVLFSEDESEDPSQNMKIEVEQENNSSKFELNKTKHINQIQPQSQLIQAYEKIEDEFKQSKRVDASQFKQVNEWEKGKVGCKIYVMLLIDSTVYVKIHDLRYKNSALCADFLLSNAILVKK